MREDNNIAITKRAGLSRPVMFLMAVAILMLGFALGARQHEIIGALRYSFGLQDDTVASLDMTSLKETYQRLQEKYSGKIENNKLIEGANRGMVEALGDDYTVYMNQSEAQEFEKDLSGDVGFGIGVEVGMRKKLPTVLNVLADHPAEKAGVRSGDAIVKVNNESTENRSISQVTEKIKGEEGTSVKIEVIRGSDRQRKEFNITRRKIDNPSVSYKIEKNIGILKISRFDGQVANLARKAANEFKDKNVKAVILDLRGNGGGYLSASVDVASLWLNDKVVVSEQKRGGKRNELKSDKASALFDNMKTIVLVNGSSASASEIVAGALKDHDMAKLIGETTFGKGSVQSTTALSNGAVLKVTVAKWYTPKGNNINKEGITPDETVLMTQDDYDNMRDPQLEKAIGEASR